MIALLTLAGYQFTEVMLTETSATNMYGRRVQVRSFANSGAEIAAAKLGERQLVDATNAAEINLYHNPQVFGGFLMAGTDNDEARKRGRFSIISPIAGDETASTIRFGLADESGKLNINVVGKIAGKGEEGETLANYILAGADETTGIPGMTPELADVILDWIDEDDEERLMGAESLQYQADNITCKNGPLESLDELLNIPGITARMVYGFDANRNGIIDPAERAAAQASDTPDLHPLGWSAFLTTYSKEWNRRFDGSEKININNGVLADLYDDLVEEYADGDGEEIAKFIVAYRMNGPSNATEENQPASTGLSNANTSTGGGNARQSGGAVLSQQAVKKAATSIGSALFKAGGDVGKTVTKGGMDLSGGAKVTINSIYDLVDAEVKVEINGAQQTLTSPWTSDNMLEKLPDTLNRLTTVDGTYIEGRININEARYDVLLAVIASIEGFDEDINLAKDLVNKIIANKMVDSNGSPIAATIATRATTAWLITEGLVTLQQMRTLDRYLTTRGDVYRAQILGYFDQGGPMVRMETIIDATQKPPRIVFLRDLTELGKGFTAKQLTPSK